MNSWGTDLNCPETDEYSLKGTNNLFQIYPILDEKHVYQPNASSTLSVWAEDAGAGLVILNNTGYNGQQFDLEMPNNQMLVPEQAPRQYFVVIPDFGSIKLDSLSDYVCDNSRVVYQELIFGLTKGG